MAGGRAWAPPGGGGSLERDPFVRSTHQAGVAGAKALRQAPAWWVGTARSRRGGSRGREGGEEVRGRWGQEGDLGHPFCCTFQGIPFQTFSPSFPRACVSLRQRLSFHCHRPVPAGRPPVGPLLLTPESSTVPGSYGVTIDCWTPGGMVGPATRGVWGHSLCSQETSSVASPGARGPAVGVRVT